MGEAPRLIIFDCDGVLVDSEPISISVLVAAIEAAGGTVSEEAAYRRFLGMSMASIGRILDADFGVRMTEAHLEAMREQLQGRFIDELKPMPGIKTALQTLGQRRCVASSSTLDRIRLSLRVTGLLDLLEPSIYSASMVSKGKPAPDLFLHAAREMGVPPAACLVIEDSPAGVSAARQAGMRVFAFAGGSHAGKASLHESLAALRPDAVFDDMLRLPALVAMSGSPAEAS